MKTLVSKRLQSFGYRCPEFIGRGFKSVLAQKEGDPCFDGNEREHWGYGRISAATATVTLGGKRGFLLRYYHRGFLPAKSACVAYGKEGVASGAASPQKQVKLPTGEAGSLGEHLLEGDAGATFLAAAGKNLAAALAAGANQEAVGTGALLLFGLVCERHGEESLAEIPCI